MFHEFIDFAPNFGNKDRVERRIDVTDGVPSYLWKIQNGFSHADRFKCNKFFDKDTNSYVYIFSIYGVRKEDVKITQTGRTINVSASSDNRILGQLSFKFSETLKEGEKVSKCVVQDGLLYIYLEKAEEKENTVELKVQ